MQNFLSWLNGPQGHALGSVLFIAASTFFPQYAGILQAIAAVLGYGAGVKAAAPAPGDAPKA
jgi:hypothetical protein